MSKTQLPKISQQQKQFDIGRENAIRRRILKEYVMMIDDSNTNTHNQQQFSFNKRRDDFNNLREYNDYLEEVEDISK
jgi:hypothetical protein